MMTQEKFDWLQIWIEVHENRFTHRFFIKIIFMNQGQDVVKLPFSNTKRKAELIGLQIRDETGKPVEPETGLMIRPKKKEVDTHRIMPGGSWIYKLRGKRCKGHLEFPGAIYHLPPKKGCKIQFRYKEIWSNTVEWTVPA